MNMRKFKSNSPLNPTSHGKIYPKEKRSDLQLESKRLSRRTNVIGNFNNESGLKTQTRFMSLIKVVNIISDKVNKIN